MEYTENQARAAARALDSVKTHEQIMANVQPMPERIMAWAYCYNEMPYDADWTAWYRWLVPDYGSLHPAFRVLADYLGTFLMDHRERQQQSDPERETGWVSQ